MPKYFFGITLPATIDAEVESWRRRFRAPKTPAHITLIPPFLWEGSETMLINAALKSINNKPPFSVTAEELGSFGKGVIFIDIHPSNKLVSINKELVSNLSELGIQLDKRPYHPHITLATRLKPGQFINYQRELADYNPKFSFECEHITVFILDESGKFNSWIKWNELNLGSN